MTTDQFRNRIRRLTNTLVTDYSDADLISDLNAELSTIQISILSARGVLEYDDPTYTDLPVATFAVLAGTRSYKITNDGNSNLLLTKHKVSLNGRDIPRRQVGEGQQEPLLDTTSSNFPNCYYEVGDSIVFGQIPAVSGTATVWFDRDVSFLVTSDTTRVPGIPVAYHKLAAYRTALTYALDKSLPNLGSIQALIDREEETLKTFEENRRGDEQTVIRVEVIRGL